MIFAVDPGPEQSAYVLYDEHAGAPFEWAKLPNAHVRDAAATTMADRLAVEMIASYGMAVSASVFETCVWVGRFIEAARPHDPQLVYRMDVKMHLCHDSRAKDANIRQALIDRYGGKEKAIGRKRSPGPLYGLTGDCWAALGVAITAAETAA